MQVLMLVCRDTERAEETGNEPDIEEWVTTNDAAGRRLAGDILQPEAATAAVRVRAGQTLVTDGPFLETKEMLLGFDLLECKDMAEAVEIAAGHPMAWTSVIELRPVLEQ